ncbi:putative RNA helicase [Helianthus annuus]|nr:putative RNA helicase [Helianthus annuus]
MLMKASTPAALPINFKSRFTVVSNSRVTSYNNCKEIGRRGVVTAAGYRKRSLETPGAYELVDEESGDKFIVWGGTDDEAPIPTPTNEVLHWKPPSTRPPTASSKGVSPSFERLRAYPSHIQAMSFPHVIKGKSCIIADQSGSGKTLAYLLPVIQSIRQDELEGLAKSLPQSPRLVILVPTAELASQVLRNCRLMSKSGVPFRSMIATGGFKQKTQLESLRNELDVLIATPGRFLYLVQQGFLHLTNLKCAVLDEVDILFKDEDFQPALESLMNLAPVTTQYLFVTATLPVNVYNKLVENFPDCQVIMGPGMHRTSSGLEEILVDCSGEDGMEKTQDTAFVNKKSALLKLVEEGPVTKTIIFCNKIETCRKVENALTRSNRKVLPFHAALAQDLRVANMEEFCQTRSKDSSLFLVCTDRASRGIDIPGVDQVVLFDFPRDPSEYVRRVGRTARGAGGKGRAFIFVVGKQVSLARRIIERNRKGHPLHDVPSN